jgi:hypothetical protein
MWTLSNKTGLSVANGGKWRSSPGGRFPDNPNFLINRPKVAAEGSR